MKVGSNRFLALLGALLLLSGGIQPPAVHAAATLELYGTFQTLGVIVTVAAGDDADQDATATVTYRTGSDAYRAGFPLSRVSATRFVGSLFWLKPGTFYDVRVTFSDPDGGPLNGASVQASASTRAEITIPAPTRSYTVSPSGSGTECSLAAPCPLAYALNQAQAGEEVVLRGGVYYQGEFDLPRSGAAGAPIVIRSYTGETAVLDGADPATFTWTAQGGGVYRATVNAANPHVVLANGARLFPYQSLANLQNLSWGVPGFYASGATVYVHLAGDADPNTATMAVSRYNYAFYVEQNHVYFVNLTFRYYGQGDWAKAIYFLDASDNLVQGSTFASNDVGVGIKYNSHRNVVQDNVFYDTIFDWPWDGVKTGAGGAIEDGGVYIYEPSAGRGNVIRRNTFHDDFDGLHVCPETEVVSNETDVYENLVYNMGDDGMETDGLCSNVRIWRNTFHDTLMGVSLAPVLTGPVYAIRNVIYRTGVHGQYGSSFKFNVDYGPSGPIYLFHNTADAALPNQNGLTIFEPGAWKTIYARNNAWAGTAYALENYNTSQPVDLDYDDLWNHSSGDLVRWNNVNYATLAAFTAATGQESHGRSVAPGFADAASGDYALNATSGLIDQGVPIPGINDDFAGTAPDIGACEYASYGFTLNVLPSARAIAPGGVATYTIGVQPVGGFSATVTLIAANPSPSLTLNLAPAAITPPAQATLTLTDTHTAMWLLPGLWYSVPITASGDGVTQSVSVGLLVGGARVYLPLVMKDHM